MRAHFMESSLMESCTAASQAKGLHVVVGDCQCSARIRSMIGLRHR
jgi:hypothetical protein